MPRRERAAAPVRVFLLLAVCVLAVMAGRGPAMAAPEQAAPEQAARKPAAPKSPAQKFSAPKSAEGTACPPAAPDQKAKAQTLSGQKPSTPKPSVPKPSGANATAQKAVPTSTEPKQATKPAPTRKAPESKASDQKVSTTLSSPAQTSPQAAQAKTAPASGAKAPSGTARSVPAAKSDAPKPCPPAAAASAPKPGPPAKAASAAKPGTPDPAAAAAKPGASASASAPVAPAANPPRSGTPAPAATAPKSGAFASAPLLTASPAPGLDHPFETACALDAKRILPPELLSGPDHQVEEAVENDGYVNTYTVKSRFGEYRVTSNYLLAVRVGEFKAMEVMDKGVGIKEFGLGVWQGGVSLVTGVKDLVLHPVDTVKSAASGVGKLFTRTEEGISGSPSSKYEDSTGAKMIGYASTRREYAKTFGVDPYSANQPMQKRLDSLARAGYAGGLTSMGLKALIPGGIGIAVSSVSGVNWLGEVDVAQPPADLRKANREALAAMGVDNATILRFMDNGEYTPTCQTLLVHALKELGRTGGLSAFVRQAARAKGPDQALFRQRMAQMYAAYGAKVAEVEGFLTMGNLVGARAADGALVICLPVDHLSWTEGLALMAEAARPLRDTTRGGVVQLWAAGTVSDLAKRVLTARGWQVREDAAQELMGEKLFVK